jgi:hypothetical protein
LRILRVFDSILFSKKEEDDDDDDEKKEDFTLISGI